MELWFKGGYKTLNEVCSLVKLFKNELRSRNQALTTNFRTHS